MSYDDIGKDEKIDMLMECFDLIENGKEKEFPALLKKVTLEKATINVFNKIFGKDYLKNGGYNVSKAE